jgi:hypothetical protein
MRDTPVALQLMIQWILNTEYRRMCRSFEFDRRLLFLLLLLRKKRNALLGPRVEQRSL